MGSNIVGTFGRFRLFSSAAWIALVPLVGTASCSSNDDAGTSAEELAEGAGRWELPSDVRTAGARVSIAYEDATAWDGGRHCNGGLRQGAQTLGHKLMDRFSGISSVGGYACRQNTADARRMSVHGSGRALDLMIPTAGRSADAEAGDPIANWLVVNARAIGVQLIIWNHSMWRANGTNLASYSGPNPHVDHIHVEITDAAARERTTFFTSGGTVNPATDAGVSDPNADLGNDALDDDGGAYGKPSYDAGVKNPSSQGPYDPYADPNSDPYANDPYANDPSIGGYTPDDDPYDTQGSDSNANGAYPSDPYASDPYGADPYANDPYANDPYPSGSDTPPSTGGSPGTTTASGGARSDAGTANPIAPRPYPATPDDGVGAPDSLGTGTRATPRTKAAEGATHPPIETCAATPGTHPIGRGLGSWTALTIGALLARRRRYFTSAK